MATCPICAAGEPFDVVGALRTVWITAAPDAPLPAYVCVVAKRHVDEPYQLPPEEMLAFWDESMLVARTLAGLVAPRKMNYEIHGNTLPHLHLHLYPRFDGDPFEGQPIDGRQRSFHRTPVELDRLRQAFSELH
ncbi:MAG TPA: HIT family protein [Acidimicrobiales bacterium]|nr:HIT family protein [Acidimicrobiales bacterium]